jgi:hypothetical protein
VCRQRAAYRWKDVDESYNFSSDFIAIEHFHTKLCSSKIVEVPSVGISGLSFGSPGTKNHLDVAPVERCRVYYKGGGGGFPQVRAMVNVRSSCTPFISRYALTKFIRGWNYYVVIF